MLEKYRYTQLVLSCSLRSHHKTNPTPKMATPYLALPTHHPEKDSKIRIERVKNGIQKYTVERKRRRAWNATAANERFHASGGVCPQKHLYEFESVSPARTFVNPPPA